MAPQTWKLDCNSSQFSQHCNKKKLFTVAVRTCFTFYRRQLRCLMTKVDIKRPNKHKTHDTTVPTYTHVPKNYALITATGAPSHQQSLRHGTPKSSAQGTKTDDKKNAEILKKAPRCNFINNSINETNWNEIIPSKCIIKKVKTLCVAKLPLRIRIPFPFIRSLPLVLPQEKLAKSPTIMNS